MARKEGFKAHTEREIPVTVGLAIRGGQGRAGDKRRSGSGWRRRGRGQLGIEREREGEGFCCVLSEREGAPLL